VTATSFTLVTAEDPDHVFAFGLDIDLPSGRDVITFRRDADGRAVFGVHDSPEAARKRFSLVVPLELRLGAICRC
jgi:hypothetical protein